MCTFAQVVHGLTYDLTNLNLGKPINPLDLP